MGGIRGDTRSLDYGSNCSGLTRGHDYCSEVRAVVITIIIITATTTTIISTPLPPPADLTDSCNHFSQSLVSWGDKTCSVRRDLANEQWRALQVCQHC